ncbi:FtsB family cell division protein [Bacillus chungangensis]|uniref:Cell division protein DivIC n=1 Tax=Bacillus chungangensis TaxID=587633 RepID=A0ABT9WX72_9BACI|nr:septum formation initiator family protein [Bacillus chungangensis]MDQ0177893.1 cell division protein DivIC [Bacillus chungangensis]
MSVKPKRNITSMQNEYIDQKKQKANKLVKKRKLLFRRLTVFFLVAAAVSYLFISTLITQNRQLESKKAEKAKLEQQLAKLQSKQTMLEDEILKLNDDEYIAKLARSEYFLSDEGEIIFSIPDEEHEDEEEEVSY